MTTVLDLSQQDLKSGILGLVVALVEVVKDTLRLQALRRMDAGGLSVAEVDRLGEALLDLDNVIQRLKTETGIAESVRSIRDSLDKAVADAVGNLLDPYEWERTSLEAGHVNS